MSVECPTCDRDLWNPAHNDVCPRKLTRRITELTAEVERLRADNARLRAVPAGRRRPVVEGDYR